MSSQSPKNSSRTKPSRSSGPSDIVVIGEWWKTCVACSYFKEKGVKARALCTLQGPYSVGVHLGPGDVFERARLLYGDPLTESFWNLSEKNYGLAKNYLISRQIRFHEQGLLRFFSGSNKLEHDLFLKSRRKGNRLLVEGLREPGLSFVTEDFGEIPSVIKNLSFRRLSNFSYHLSWENDPQNNSPSELSCSAILFLSESDICKLLPSLRDRLIVVSLSSFLYPRKNVVEYSLGLFNGGADYAMACRSKWQLGSFRNLYEDKAVGIHDKIDDATRSGVHKFFSSLGFIDPSDSCEPRIDVDAITCDGLPIECLGEDPGIFVVAGFAGHSGNFMFSVLNSLAEGLMAESSSYGPLALFSTKRFV